MDLIEHLYDGTSFKVIHAHCQFQHTDCINTGLSPLLFIMAMKEITPGRRNGIRWTLLTQLNDLDFADDIALLPHTQQHMQDKTSALKELSLRIGLMIHPAKSKILKVETQLGGQVNVNGHVLENVDSFCYLGNIVGGEEGTGAEVKSSIGKAQTVFISLNKIWRTKDISLSTKLIIFN